MPLLLLEVTLARLLGPNLYGIWSIIQTLATYGNFLHFGVASSLARREPGLIERGACDEVLANRAAAFGFQFLVVGIVASLVLALWAMVNNIFYSIGGLSTALAVLLVILFQQITITTQASALNEYKVIQSSLARLCYAFTFLFVGLIAARNDPPLLWLTLSWATALITALGLLNAMARDIMVIPTIDIARTVSLLQDGFPIMVQGLMRFGLMSIDKLAVFAVARPEMVGYYGMGSLAASVSGLFGSMIARISLPTLLRMRERAECAALVRAEFDRMLSLIQLSTYSALFIICAYVPLMIHFLLPAYHPAIHVIGILAIAGAFAGLAQAMNDVAMSLGIKVAVLVNTSVTLAALALLLALAWNLESGIEGMAISVLIAMMLMSGRGLWLGMNAVGITRNDALHRLAKAILYAVAALVLCLVILELQLLAIGALPNNTRAALVLNAILLMMIVGCLTLAFRKLFQRSGSGGPA